MAPRIESPQCLFDLRLELYICYTFTLLIVNATMKRHCTFSFVVKVGFLVGNLAVRVWTSSLMR